MATVTASSRGKTSEIVLVSLLRGRLWEGRCAVQFGATQESCCSEHPPYRRNPFIDRDFPQAKCDGLNWDRTVVTGFTRSRAAVLGARSTRQALLSLVRAPTPPFYEFHSGYNPSRSLSHNCDKYIPLPVSGAVQIRFGTTQALSLSQPCYMWETSCLKDHPIQRSGILST